MICFPCKIGGEFLADGNPSQAEVEHSFCENAISGTDNWCDCQHRVTPAVISRIQSRSTVLIGAANE